MRKEIQDRLNKLKERFLKQLWHSFGIDEEDIHNGRRVGDLSTYELQELIKEKKEVKK